MCDFPYQSGGPGSVGVDLVFGAADPGARAPRAPVSPPTPAAAGAHHPNKPRPRPAALGGRARRACARPRLLALAKQPVPTILLITLAGQHLGQGGARWESRNTTRLPLLRGKAR